MQRPSGGTVPGLFQKQLCSQTFSVVGRGLGNKAREITARAPGPSKDSVITLACPLWDLEKP